MRDASLTAAISRVHPVRVTAAAALAGFAGLFADQTRAAMCLALLDGRAWTAGELAKHAGVAPSTATAHLSQLVDGGVLTDQKRGRHRYLRLADANIASLIEDLAAHVDSADQPMTLKETIRASALARARTCYDHLAGRLGVAIADAMSRRDLVTDSGFALTEAGLAWLSTLDIDVEALRNARRPIVRPCLDWTERRFHLAGSSGAALCALATKKRWVTRIGTGRALKVTPSGAKALHELLGLDEKHWSEG
jgi:DNA-binding transcriptional ArsR family regulator